MPVNKTVMDWKIQPFFPCEIISHVSIVNKVFTNWEMHGQSEVADPAPLIVIRYACNVVSECTPSHHVYKQRAMRADRSIGCLESQEGHGLVSDALNTVIWRHQTYGKRPLRLQKRKPTSAILWGTLSKIFFF